MRKQIFVSLILTIGVCAWHNFEEGCSRRRQFVVQQNQGARPVNERVQILATDWDSRCITIVTVYDAQRMDPIVQELARTPEFKDQLLAQGFNRVRLEGGHEYPLR
jgi:hypothetical protein